MAPSVSICHFEGCRRQPAFEGHGFCEDHRLRWVTREPARRTEPEWLRRARSNTLPAKEYTGSVA